MHNDSAIYVLHLAGRGSDDSMNAIAAGIFARTALCSEVHRTSASRATETKMKRSTLTRENKVHALGMGNVVEVGCESWICHQATWCLDPPILTSRLWNLDIYLVNLSLCRILDHDTVNLGTVNCNLDLRHV